jgi:hypothetical protein
MTRFDSRLITPPREEEEVYPYRRAWRSIALEGIILFGVITALYAATNFFSLQIPSSFNRQINIILALLPALLWLIFSWIPERFVPQPRQPVPSATRQS